MTKDSPWIVKNQDKVEARRREMEAAAEREEGLHRPARPSMKSIRKSPGRPRREEYVELLPGKDRRRRRGQWGEDESEEEPRTPPGPRGLELLVIHFFGRWNAVTQPICLVVSLLSRYLALSLGARFPRTSTDRLLLAPIVTTDTQLHHALRLVPHRLQSSSLTGPHRAPSPSHRRRRGQLASSRRLGPRMHRYRSEQHSSIASVVHHSQCTSSLPNFRRLTFVSLPTDEVDGRCRAIHVHRFE